MNAMLRRGEAPAMPTAAQVRQHHTAVSHITAFLEDAPIPAVEEALSGLITAYRGHPAMQRSIHSMFQRLERAADRGLW